MQNIKKNILFGFFLTSIIPLSEVFSCVDETRSVIQKNGSVTIDNLANPINGVKIHLDKTNQLSNGD